VIEENKTHNNEAFLLKGTNEIGILLLHGWSSPPDELFPLAEYLNSFDHTVSVPTLRGHGTRPEDLLGVTSRDWLSDARDALEKLKKHAPRIFLGGISMGGNLALLLSEDESVAGIFTMGASVKYRFHGLIRPILFLMGIAKTYRRKYYPPWVKKQMGERETYMYYPVASAKEALRLADDSRKFMPKITKPILVMQSDSDHMVSKKSPRMIYESVKSEVKEVFWIENAYHVFVKKKEVWEKIRKFIEKISNV